MIPRSNTTCIQHPAIGIRHALDPGARDHRPRFAHVTQHHIHRPAFPRILVGPTTPNALLFTICGGSPLQLYQPLTFTLHQPSLDPAPIPLTHKIPHAVPNLLTQEVALQSIRASRRLSRYNINPHHSSTRTRAIHRNLAPAARRKAEIYDRIARTEKAVLGVDFEELEGRAGLESAEFGGLRVGVSGLARLPAGGRGG